MTLSDAVRQTMNRRKWNADAIAAAAGLARSTIFEILDGHDEVRVRTLRKLKKIGVKHPLVAAT